MKCIIYKMSDNSISLRSICQNDGQYCYGIQQLIEEGGMSENDAIQAAALQNAPSIEFYVVDSAMLPGGQVTGEYDSYFWNAFRFDGTQVIIDMNVARTIHMNNLRRIRATKFNALGFPNRLDPDVEKAIVSIDTQNLLQNLRNIPQIFDLSSAPTPDELKKLIPDILQGV